jgi:Zn-dependent protease/CBS domain-containing protein
LFGISILVHPLWFVLFGLTTLLLATDFYPHMLQDRGRATHIAAAVASSLLFFASILLHELAHSVVARLYRIPVRSITLFLFGGVAQITREAARPTAELLMALAGPATSILLAAAFLGVWFAAGAGEHTPLELMLLWLTIMNAIIGVFNLLPAFPMDGGRVLRSLLWLASGNLFRSTQIAGWTGRTIAWGMIAVGILGLAGRDLFIVDNAMNGAWFMLVGFFLENAARQGLLHNRLVKTLGQYRASDLMTPDPPVVDAEMSVAALARGVLDLNPRVCYFVEEQGRLAGIVSAYQMRAIPELMWDRTTAREAMVPSARLQAVAPDRPAADVLVEMVDDEMAHLPVVADGRVIGVIGRDRIFGVLRQAGLLPAN